MPYKALKACKFDKKYSIGEEIPASVVDRTRSKFLEEIGIIAAIGSDESLDRERGFVAASEKTEKAAEVKADKVPEVKVDKISKAQLKKMDKTQLNELASSLGLEVEGLTNTQIIEAILIAEEQKEGE